MDVQLELQLHFQEDDAVKPHIIKFKEWRNVFWTENMQNEQQWSEQGEKYQLQIEKESIREERHLRKWWN